MNRQIPKLVYNIFQLVEDTYDKKKGGRGVTTSMKSEQAWTPYTQ